MMKERHKEFMRINFNDRDLRSPFAIVLLFCAAIRCYSQGMVNITFDGPPAISPGARIGVTAYSEAGILFSPLNGSSSFTRAGANPPSAAPDNGSGYLASTFVPQQELMFTRAGGLLFSLDSVDLAEYSTVVPDAVTVQFVGYHPDGSTVTTSFTTDGIIDGTGPLADFQTFNFDSKDWSDLTRVEVPSVGWSMDNVVVSIPEPKFSVFVLAAGMSFGIYRRMKSRRRSDRKSDV